MIFSDVGTGYAAGVAQPRIKVAYALSLDDKDPIFGQVDCQIDVSCELLDERRSDVQLSITIGSVERLSGAVNINCREPGCSFLNGKTSARLEMMSGGENGRHVDLYCGQEDSVSTNLVYLKRTRIGRILLLFGSR